MPYGFLGLRPTADGFAIEPHLPNDWPSLTISRIHLHDKVLEITARDKSISITGTGSGAEPLLVELPNDWKLTSLSTNLARLSHSQSQAR